MFSHRSTTLCTCAPPLFCSAIVSPRVPFNNSLHVCCTPTIGPPPACLFHCVSLCCTCTHSPCFSLCTNTPLAPPKTRNERYFAHPANDGVRKNLTIHKSTDGGETWPNAKVCVVICFACFGFRFLRSLYFCAQGVANLLRSAESFFNMTHTGRREGEMEREGEHVYVDTCTSSVQSICVWV